MSEHTESLENKISSQTKKLYPISWLNRLTNWVDSLPIPAWLFYVMLLLVLLILNNAVL